MHKNEVAIIGGGIPGLTLALILAQQGIAVTVIEKAKLRESVDAVKPSARTTAIMHGSMASLRRSGIWGEFKEHCTPLAGLSIVDDSAFPRGGDAMVRQDFRPQEIGQDIFGYNMPLLPLTAALAVKVRQSPGIRPIDEAIVTDILVHDTGVEIALEGHEAVTAAVMAGADGRHSVVREKAGIKAATTDYGQKAITCLIAHTQPHNNISTEFHRTGGPFTFVPMPNMRSAVVWVEKTADADALMALPRAAFADALQARSRDLLGRIELESDPESWPLMALRAESLTAPRTVLIAEAAHVLSPIGAQGLNLSLRDVDALAETLITAMQTGQDIGGETVLSAYARQRRKDTLLRNRGVDLLNRGVANDNALLRGLRRLGLRSLSHAGPLRTALMQEALGAGNA